MALPKLKRGSRVFVLTGAGISAESGIPTFRDSGGLWENYSIEEMATPQGFFANPAKVWRFYVERRRQVLEAKPNPAHLALVELERFVGSSTFLLITQNVDGLHRRAGSKSLIEIHGSMFRDKCTRCDYVVETQELYADVPPKCPKCGAILRPDVVWFGESLDRKLLAKAFAHLAAAELFLAVGTSGLVQPVASFVYQTSAFKIYVGLETPANADGFDEIVLGKAGEKLPEVVNKLIGKE